MDLSLKRILSALTAAAMSLTMAVTAAPTEKVQAAGQLLAFPGAVGGGKYATGGRGGEVYHVTNLNDSGEGSFRDAVSKSGRIVVFDVSGTIELESAVSSAGNVTIAGQTAPGGAGITLKNYKMAFGGDNIICRFLSSRPGPYKATSSGNDAWGGSKGANSIVDHCSIGWASDEQWGLYSNNTNYTVQYTVIGPANSWGGHDKGIHGFAIMMGNSGLTFDHNLIIHNVSRNFRGKIPGTGVADFTNNIIYDWGYQTAYGTIGHVNYVNNTLKAGNSTTGGYHWMNVDSTTKPENFKVYCAGNRLINKDGSLNGITYNNWDGVTVKDGIGITKDNLYSASPFSIDVNGENVSTATTCESAEASYEHVISFAGNGIAPDKRTAIDQQCAYETRTGTGTCSGTAAYDGSVSDLNKYSIKCGVNYEYPGSVLQKTITDADNDGMDDEWETARGLNPADPTDYKGDYLGDGYMNIEYYINDLTVDAFPEGVVGLSPATGPAAGKSAFEKIEAEDYDAMDGVQTEDTSDDNGDQNVGFIENGDYVMYKRLDFGDGAKSLTLRASGNPCMIEVCSDTLGSPIAKIPYAGTGSFSDWQTVTFNIPELKGMHNLYLRFVGDEGYLMNLNWLRFNADALPENRLITELSVKDADHAASWVITPASDTGTLVFGDRTFTYTEYPAELAGSEGILTACDSKNWNSDAATFTAAADMTVYVGLDSRLENVPVWMEGYTKTALTALTSNDVTFEYYSKQVAAGESVLLGTNGQSAYCVNYVVQAVPSQTIAPTEPTEEPTEPTDAPTEPTEEPTDAPTEPTEEPTDAPTEPTSATSEPDEPYSEICGDVNCDGVVNILDVICLNKNLMTGDPIPAQGRINADANASGGNPDEADALTILKFVVEIIPELPAV
ncbi:MAG: carbohydrate-binding protein [Oscillospiraceae bacterium]|nr:carbohydrate-binding protein [Oscillospiraceae bacterium]